MDAEMTLTAVEANANTPVLYMAFELANKEWKVAFSDGRPRPRIVRVPAGDLAQLDAEIGSARDRFGLGESCRLVSCYEAGRDGFWLHRKLLSDGISNLVVDPASIEVNRRRRQAKTDRIDVRKLMSRLIRHGRGEPDVWSVVRVPSLADEDARELHREIQTLTNEINQHRARIDSLLVKAGVRLCVNKKFLASLNSAELWDGSPLPPVLVGRLKREYTRLEQAEKQKLELQAQRRLALKEPATKPLAKIAQLQQLCGVGETGAWLLVMEFFWRSFDNRKEVGAAAGLVGTPFDSGDSQREQGISKAGNKRVRSMMVELAWCWLRYQPQSARAQWFQKRFGEGRGKRKIGIVALARKLLVDFWRYLEKGVVPPGAQLKAA